MAKSKISRLRPNINDWPKLNPGDAKGFNIAGDLFVKGMIHANTLFGNLEKGAVGSDELAIADGTTGQNTRRGRGVKTAHIQDEAITEDKLHRSVQQKIAQGNSGRRALEVINFRGEDPDGSMKTISLDFQPEFMLSLSMISSWFLNPSFKAHGGLTGGYADFGDDEIHQVSIGPIVHVVSDGTSPSNFRMSTIGPHTATDASLDDQHGVAISLLEFFPPHLEELILVRAQEISGNKITFQLRKAKKEIQDLDIQFSLDCYFLFFG